MLRAKALSQPQRTAPTAFHKSILPATLSGDETERGKTNILAHKQNDWTVFALSEGRSMIFNPSIYAVFYAISSILVVVLVMAKSRPATPHAHLKRRTSDVFTLQRQPSLPAPSRPTPTAPDSLSGKTLSKVSKSFQIALSTAHPQPKIFPYDYSFRDY